MNKFQHFQSRTRSPDPDRQLLAQLADGGVHSGADLAHILGVTRTAIWKRLAGLTARGVQLDRIRGRGYRLAQPVDLLDADRIQSGLRPGIRAVLQEVRVDFFTDSTSQRLLQAPDCHGRVWLAEFQSNGRGRRGNTWISPLASGICMSLGWRLEAAPADAGALSILAGAALIRALHRIGVRGIGLKWPNDLMYQGCKAGGLLIESRAQLAGPMEIVIGVGLNVRLPRGMEVAGDNQPADLSQCCAHPPARNEIVVVVVEELVDMLTALSAGKISAYRDEWRQHDLSIGHAAELRLAAESLHGHVLGISDAGLLRMSVNGVEREFASGELSLRLR